jgi:hypothetical protein
MALSDAADQLTIVMARFGLREIAFGGAEHRLAIERDNDSSARARGDVD